jgi:hypothetical protein
VRDTRERLRSGDLAYRITLMAPAGAPGSIGEVDTVIEDGVPAGIWALAPQFQAYENLAIGGLQTSTKYLISVRLRTDIQPSWVLIEDGGLARRFQILSRVPSEHGDALDMTCVTDG